MPLIDTFRLEDVNPKRAPLSQRTAMTSSTGFDEHRILCGLKDKFQCLYICDKSKLIELDSEHLLLL